ncbi:hypothetical protein EC968_000278 [Mortierella alpina]|nr:hypothetical protein EC968_000278 [Mortierella alpina]
MSAAHTFFATPELVSILFTFVDPHDLTQCVRVCKKWLQLAEPVLWTSFPQDLLEGKMQHISHPIPQWSLVKLLQCNRRLTELSLLFDRFDMDDEVLAAISNLECLEYIDIQGRRTGFKRCGSRTVLLLLQACLPLPNLTELFLDFDMVWDDEGMDATVPDLETIIKDATTARFSKCSSASKIRSLYLPTWDERNKSKPLPFLLMKSGILDLRHFMIPTFMENTRPEEVEQLVREYCPSLVHVECSNYYDDSENRLIRAFIRGCSGLKTFTAENFGDQTLGDNLPDEDDEDPPGEMRFILRELVTHHSRTLEGLDLPSCYRAFSCDLQAILSQCKQLKQFRVVAFGLEKPIGIKFTDVAKSDWVCVDLTELGVTLNRHSTDEDEALDPERMAHVAKNFYTQIGRLEKLEELVIEIDKSQYTVAKESDYVWDLTLSKGWLGQMAGLRSLETLTLYDDFLSRMGQAEMEFIHEHWPLLTTINFSRNGMRCDRLPHWRWLFEKRPNLRVVSFDGFGETVFNDPRSKSKSVPRESELDRILSL